MGILKTIGQIFPTSGAGLFEGGGSSRRKWLLYNMLFNQDPTPTYSVKKSTDRAEVVLGIGEGEIEGLADGVKSFYIGNTALQNISGEKNFKDFNLEIYTGSGVDEDLQYLLGGSARNTTVGVELSYNVPVVRQTQDGGIDFIEIRFVISALRGTYVDKKGSYTTSAGLLMQMEYKPKSENNWRPAIGEDGKFKLDGTVMGNTVKEFRIAVPRIDEPYEVRITKLSKNKNSSTEANVISWESFQEGYFSNVSFPNTALAHIYFQYSNQISSIPNFYGIYKLMKIRIPSNYNPETREYTGTWDGTFKRAWSDNPAWCLYDFVMNDRYGVNAYSPVVLDKWDCYEAAQWCDELVSDGFGGQQPRYTCNLVQTQATNGREFAVYLASLFNGVLVEPSTGYLRLFVERESEAVFLFTPENVTEQGFSYSFTSPETRYNDIKVSFTNPELNWEADTRRVYSQEDIDINGRVTYDFIAVGCIREGEAMRRAQYKLSTSLNEKMMVTFTTNRQAQSLSNFDVILIADPVLGYSLPGRLKSVSVDRKTIYLRDPVYLEAGIPYKIQFNTPDGLYENEIDPLSGTGRLTEFTVKEALPENLPELAVFTISGSSKSGTPKPFRITAISEVDGNPDNYSIAALEIHRGKWADADNLDLSNMDNYSGLVSVNDIPHLANLDFFMTYNKATAQSELYLTPTYADVEYPYYSGQLKVYSKSIYEEDWIQREVTADNVIANHPAGEYQFIALPVSTTGITPLFDTAPIFTYTVENVTDYPSNVKNLTVERSSNGVQLFWEAVPDVDLAGYEVREGSDWESGKVIVTALAGTSTYIVINDAKTHHYMVCAQNYLDLYSQVPAYVSTSVEVPGDVQNFYATVSLDRVRFDWTTVPGNDMEYEIRQGDNWSTAVKVARLKGNNTTVLLPSLPDITYCIKACTPAGLFSINPRYAKPDMKLAPDRNIIKVFDNGAEGFPGITYGFEPYRDEHGEIVPNTMIMSQEFLRAEHYFTVELEKETRARNWFETSAFSNPTRMTWEDMHFMYIQPEAHISWLGSVNLDAEGEVEPVIARYIGAEGYTGFLGFPYSSDTDDIRQLIHSTEENNVTFDYSHFTKGLVLEEDTYVNYDSITTIPPEFSFTFKIKVTNETQGRTNFITLTGPNNNYVKVYMYDGYIYARFSDHKDLVVQSRYAAHFDFLTIGLSQSETERSLYFFSDYGNLSESDTIEASPTGTFTKYYINRNLGEPL